MATILMRKGTLQHEVAEHDVQRWVGYGYEVIAPLPQESDGGKEVAGDADVSPVAPTVTPKKRTTTRKKGAQKDDKS
jgi:hypothetical protein